MKDGTTNTIQIIVDHSSIHSLNTHFYYYYSIHPGGDTKQTGRVEREPTRSQTTNITINLRVS